MCYLGWKVTKEHVINVSGQIRGWDSIDQSGAQASVLLKALYVILKVRPRLRTTALGSFCPELGLG